MLGDRYGQNAKTTYPFFRHAVKKLFRVILSLGVWQVSGNSKSRDGAARSVMLSYFTGVFQHLHHQRQQE